jgi:hypothetical protein
MLLQGTEMRACVFPELKYKSKMSSEGVAGVRTKCLIVRGP